jgi:hypothetical protein
MKKAACGIGLVALAAVAWAWPQEKAKAPAGDLVVHEWGTFTSMQGSDGATLEGLQHEEEGLPPFVYSRTKVRECPLRDKGYKGLEVEVEGVTKKMETPVTYFYTDRPGRARVRVCFKQGLLTQWYPVTDLLGPAEAGRNDGPLDLAKVEKSFLEWDVEILPKGAGLSEIPAVEKGDPWGFARLPDSNVLRTTERRTPRMGPVEAEKFLFYRGIGRFSLPLRAVTSKGGEVTVHNDGDEPIRHVCAMRREGGTASLDYVEVVPARGSAKLTCAGGSEAGPVTEKLMALLRRALVKVGLYEKEAEAMVKTWERSYFHTEGFRLLYIVPEKFTNDVLPIAIDPAPKSMVRVLVGRLECITPEDEEEVEAALRDPSTAASKARLARLGRFLEPHVRRVLSITKDDAVKKAAKEILNEGRQP